MQETIVNKETGMCLGKYAYQYYYLIWEVKNTDSNIVGNHIIQI